MPEMIQFLTIEELKKNSDYLVTFERNYVIIEFWIDGVKQWTQFLKSANSETVELTTKEYYAMPFLNQPLAKFQLKKMGADIM